MTPEQKLEESLFIFIKDKTISTKDKIDELATINGLCQNVVTILMGEGIFSPEWMIACLEEIVNEKR